MSLFYSPVGSIEPEALSTPLRQLLHTKGQRMDGRGLADVRPTSVHISLNPMPVVTVTQGGTMVVAGIKAELGPCDSAAPNRGRLAVDATCPLVGTSVPTEQQFEGRREVASYVASVLASCSDSRSWCIRDGEACWVVYVDVVVLSVDGCLRDLSAHAARIALSKLKLPRTMLPDGTMAEECSPKMLTHPYSMTFAVFPSPSNASILVANPTMAEEYAAEGLVSIVVDAADPNSILQIIHHGGVALSPKSVIESVVAINMTIRKPEEAALRP